MALQATDSAQGIIQLSGSIIDGTTVKINFNSLPGAHPKTMGYFVAIWQGSQIQALSSALQTQKIGVDNQAGTANFTGLSLQKQDYIIGFGVDFEVGTTICSTLYVPLNSQPFDPLTPNLSSVLVPEAGIGTNSLIASYVTPLYNRPKTNANWIGLFQGPFTANCFNGTGVIASTNATSDTNTGSIAMNDIPNGLIRFQTYTVVYGMSSKAGSPNYSDIISYYSFTV
ncbi:hypothetical protein D3C87_310770 [compost metagenome]|uniref:hypothetical protein n=1 Tax=Sphingobacterium sp. TaxID=341027 RepID=UPI000FA10042|nr:hypothetical protein [Sphingobacterium sp.]WET68892.1 MAG: hypothetical protein P0Y57_23925 [Sphingobacterium sp.]